MARQETKDYIEATLAVTSFNSKQKVIALVMMAEKLELDEDVKQLLSTSLILIKECWKGKENE